MNPTSPPPPAPQQPQQPQQPKKRNNTRLYLVIAGVVVLGGLIAYLVWPPKPPGNPGKIKFATSKNAWCTLTIVADKKGYFKEEGLDVSLEYVQAAKLSMDALLSSDAQFGNVVETNPAFVGFSGSTDVEIVATHADVKDGAIIARKDRGIHNPKDLRGKRLGILQGTTSHIYAERFLEANGMQMSDVRISYLPPATIQTSLTVDNGEIDAGSIWQPFVYNVKKQLGDNAVVFWEPKVYTGLMNLAVRKDWAQKYPNAVNSAIKAHVKAEKFVREHKDEAIAIVAPEIGLPVEVLTAIWDQYGYRVYLGPQLPAEIKREGAWLTTSDEKFKGKQVPNYDWAVNPAFLKGIEAARVEN